MIRNLNSAQHCRDNGWGPGTRLVGDEGYGPTLIELTAIGEKQILAKTITHNGETPEYGRDETNWTLQCRDWQLVGEAK